MERKEIVGSRVKTSLFLAFCLAAVAAVFLRDNQNDRALSWAGVFFAVGSLVFAWLLVRPQRLLLDQEGFSLAGGFLRSPRKVAWRDVSSFFVVRVRFRTTMIGYNFSPDAKPRGAALARRISGADAALHGVWPDSNARMVDELNAYRSRALRAADF